MKPILFFLITICIGFSACEKSDDETPGKTAAPPIAKIKTMTTYSEGKIQEEYSYEYDASGRLIKQSSSKGYYSTYEYTSDTIRIMTHEPELNKITPWTLILNEQGLVISSVNGNDTREYTPEGYLAKHIYSYDDYAFSYTYKTEEENTTRRTAREGLDLSKVTIRDIYTFLPNSVNTIGNENRGITFYGKQDKNLVSEQKAIIENPYNEYKAYYTYEFDDHNRVTARSILRSTSEHYTTFTYYD